LSRPLKSHLPCVFAIERILEPEKNCKEIGQNCIMRSLISYTLYQAYLEPSSQGGRHGQGM
jgi:hypothetical protein